MSLDIREIGELYIASKYDEEENVIFIPNKNLWNAAATEDIKKTINEQRKCGIIQNYEQPSIAYVEWINLVTLRNRLYSLRAAAKPCILARICGNTAYLDDMEFQTEESLYLLLHRKLEAEFWAQVSVLNKNSKFSAEEVKQSVKLKNIPTQYTDEVLLMFSPTDFLKAMYETNFDFYR